MNTSYKPTSLEEIAEQCQLYKAKWRRRQEEGQWARAHTPRRYRRSRGLQFADMMPTPKSWCAACRKAWGGRSVCSACGGLVVSLDLRAHVPRLHAGRARWKEFYKRFPSTRPKDPQTGKAVSVAEALKMAFAR